MTVVTVFMVLEEGGRYLLIHSLVFFLESLQKFSAEAIESPVKGRVRFFGALRHDERYF